MTAVVAWARAVVEEIRKEKIRKEWIEFRRELARPWECLERKHRGGLASPRTARAREGEDEEEHNEEFEWVFKVACFEKVPRIVSRSPQQ